MKALSKFIISIILLGSILLGAVVAANYGHFDSGIKYAMQHYLSLRGIENKIHNLHFNQGNLFIDKIEIPIGQTKLILEGLSSNMSYSLSNFEYRADLSIDNISSNFAEEKKTTLNASNDLDVNDTISTGLSANIQIFPFGYYNNISLQLSNITIPIFNIKSGIAEIKIEYDQDTSDITSIVNFTDDSFLHNNYYSTSSYDFRSQASFKNLPIGLLQYVSIIFPESDLCKFLSDSFSKGIIEKGEYSIYNSKEDYQNGVSPIENLSADFSFQDGVFTYDPDMPAIENINLDAQIRSSSAMLKLSKAKIAGFDFQGSVVNVDFMPESSGNHKPQNIVHGQNQKYGKVIARGAGKGLANGLTKFIPKNLMRDLKKSGIDLSKITGNSKAELYLEVPLSESKPMNIVVQADIPSTNLDILDGKVMLRKAALKAKLLNDILTIKGAGEINEFDSDIEFSCNTSNKKDSNPNLKITSKLSTSSGKVKNPIFNIFDRVDGQSILNFRYYIKNNQNYFYIDSDLENMEIELANLGINKKIGSKANLEILGKINDVNRPASNSSNTPDSSKKSKKSNHTLDFKVIGDNNLDIKGHGEFSGEELYADIKNLRSNQTDLAAQIYYAFDETNNHTRLDLSLMGKSLDLSNFSLYEFLGNKSSDSGQTSNTNLVATIDKVLMKDSIWFSNLKTEFNCDHIRCFKGFLKSNIGSRIMELDLEESQNANAEIWKIHTTNAGAVLKSIGAYDSMKAGSLSLELTSSRKGLSNDERPISQIYSGNFKFEKFVLSDTPILTRIVSFVSLPGFLSIVTNNTDIVFSKMDGEFTMNNKILTVKEAMAVGPYFDFSLNGDVDFNNKYLDIYGHVTPELYGFSSIVKNVPLVGDFVAGSKKSAGLISTPYSIKQPY